MKNTFTLTVLTFIILTFLAGDVIAIPAFARKYIMSCKTCHSPFPTLEPYGDEFAGNGFQLKDKDAPRYYVDTGDEELSLIRDIPIALRFEGYVTYNVQNSELSDFTAPWILKLLSGGAITKDVAYYFYFFFSERREVAGIEDAFLMFNDLFSTELDFMIGQYQVSDPLFKRELRLTFDDYMIYTVRPGYSVNPQRIWTLFNHWISKAKAADDPGTITKLGVDETSTKKGHHYVTLGVDLDEARVIHVTEGKGKATLHSIQQHLENKGVDKEQIEQISMDLSPSFIAGAAESFPEAQITFDRFPCC